MRGRGFGHNSPRPSGRGGRDPASRPRSPATRSASFRLSNPHATRAGALLPCSFASLTALSLKMREPILSETPQAFRRIPNRSGGAGKEGGWGERNSRAALASKKSRMGLRKTKLLYLENDKKGRACGILPQAPWIT